MFPRIFLVTHLFSTALLCTAVAGAEEAEATNPHLPRIGVEDVLQHVDEECTVQFKVQSSRHLPDVGICFLNSKKDFRQSGNFTTVIRRNCLDVLKTMEVNDPADFYRRKTIRVTGRIELYKDKPQIVVDKVEQIEIANKQEGSDVAIESKD